MTSSEALNTQNTLIKEVPVLTQSECADVRDVLHKLKFLWDDERYRLGAGISYYSPRALYYATAKHTNPILKQHFGWVYDKLKNRLQQSYDVDVCFREDLALPGFNIYCGPNDFSKIQYNIHIDLQFLDLNWAPKGSTDFTTTMSFTLPIASPVYGAGLNIWTVTQADVAETELENSELLSNGNASYHRYEDGIATIHDGKHYHQMKVAENWLPTDERITMQGHGLMQNGALVIYG